ncbi:hypothetical protein P261_00100 [Lachnospiraceae bacterium TWA4]|nr:hypothetical protein P261_00100 [Lachnospiraceae bacterium TWA4]
MFTQRYSDSVYNKFKCGVLDYEIRSYRSWNKNKRMDKMISKIPMYIAYIMRDVA